MFMEHDYEMNWVEGMDGNWFICIWPIVLRVRKTLEQVRGKKILTVGSMANAHFVIISESELMGRWNTKSYYISKLFIR